MENDLALIKTFYHKRNSVRQHKQQMIDLKILYQYNKPGAIHRDYATITTVVQDNQLGFILSKYRITGDQIIVIGEVGINSSCIDDLINTMSSYDEKTAVTLYGVEKKN